MKKTGVGTWAFMFEETPMLFPEVLPILKRQGYETFELGSFGHHPSYSNTPSGEDRDALRESWTSLGLECTGLAGDLWDQRLITGSTNEAYMERFRAILQFAVDLQIPGVRVDTTEDPWVLGDVQGESMPKNDDTIAKYGGDGTAPRIDYDVALKNVIDTWKVCVQEAADAGKRLIWEPEPGFAFNKVDDIERILDGVGEDLLLMGDVCHAHQIGELGARQPGKKQTLDGGIAEFYKRFTGRFGRQHIIDSDGTINAHLTSTHVPLFDGMLKFDEFMEALVDAGGDDVWSIDMCFWPDATNNVQKCKAGLDQLIKQYG